MHIRSRKMQALHVQMPMHEEQYFVFTGSANYECIGVFCANRSVTMLACFVHVRFVPSIRDENMQYSYISILPSILAICCNNFSLCYVLARLRVTLHVINLYSSLLSHSANLVIRCRVYRDLDAWSVFQIVT